jgi:hypothetical protein
VHALCQLQPWKRRMHWLEAHVITAQITSLTTKSHVSAGAQREHITLSTALTSPARPCHATVQHDCAEHPQRQPTIWCTTHCPGCYLAALGLSRWLSSEVAAVLHMHCADQTNASLLCHIHVHAARKPSARSMAAGAVTNCKQPGSGT